jgi:hypothetical protein
MDNEILFHIQEIWNPVICDNVWGSRDIWWGEINQAQKDMHHVISCITLVWTSSSHRCLKENSGCHRLKKKEGVIDEYNVIMI